MLSRIFVLRQLRERVRPARFSRRGFPKYAEWRCWEPGFIPADEIQNCSRNCGVCYRPLDLHSRGNMPRIVNYQRNVNEFPVQRAPMILQVMLPEGLTVV